MKALREMNVVPPVAQNDRNRHSAIDGEPNGTPAIGSAKPNATGWRYPVTTERPARAGEILSLFASGLGPTRLDVNPGSPFPANPLAAVNSPVEVTVNGKPAEVLAAVGYPGTVP